MHSLLRKTEIVASVAAGEETWPEILRKMLWRANVSIALMRSNAQGSDHHRVSTLARV
jgi:hypothetical protein